MNAAHTSTEQAAVDGEDFASIQRNPLYWRLILTFGLLDITVTGLVAHLVPAVRHYGMSVGGAAAMESLMGLAALPVASVPGGSSMSLSRLSFWSRCVCFFAVGVVLFAAGGVEFAPVLAIALGLLLGAELDMLGYFTSRYFGLAASGRPSRTPTWSSASVASRPLLSVSLSTGPEAIAQLSMASSALPWSVRSSLCSCRIRGGRDHSRLLK